MDSKQACRVGLAGHSPSPIFLCLHLEGFLVLWCKVPPSLGDLARNLGRLGVLSELLLHLISYTHSEEDVRRLASLGRPWSLWHMQLGRITHTRGVATQIEMS